MKKAPFDLLHAVICDDVRREAGTGKSFYLGVFADQIIGAAAPVTLERFAVVFCVREVGDERIRRFKVTIDGPPGTNVPTFEEAAYNTSAGPTTSHTLILQILGVAFTPGQYAARLTLNEHAEFRLPFTVVVDERRFAEIASEK